MANTLQPKSITSETDVQEMEKKAAAALAKVRDVEALEKLRLEYLGRKGILPLALRGLKDLPTDQKRTLGPVLNNLRSFLEEQFAAKQQQLSEKDIEAQVVKEKIDVTEPVPRRPFGHLHPTEQIRREVEDVLRSMGFEEARSQEIDDDENNFSLLNIPENHPARDMWQTIWLKPPKPFKESSVRPRPGQELLLRTHTSNMQVRTIRAKKMPIRIFTIGRVFRFEATDKTHENTFHHVECFVIDNSTTLSDLQGTLQVLYEAIFGQKLKTRLRPSYFPFVEPGVEFDISCIFCRGKGCSVCKKTGWVEAAGAGMIHPNVLKNAGLNPAKYQGFAFGLGMDRITMFKFGIDDIRFLLSADLRFLQQF